MAKYNAGFVFLGVQARETSEFNQSTVADMYGFTRDALIRKIKKYNISITKGENT